MGLLLAAVLCLAGGGIYWLSRPALPAGVVTATTLSYSVSGVGLDATRGTVLALYGRMVPLAAVHRFAVIAAERGTVVHDVALGTDLPAAMVLDERSGRVLVTYSDSDSATLLDSASGQIRSTSRLPFHPFGMVFNPDTGKAVVSAMAANHYLAALIDLRSGAVRRTIALQARGPAYGAGAPVLDPTAHRLLIASPGGVNILDARSLHLIRFTPIAAGDPDKIIVDSQTHRAYVTLVNVLAPSCPAANRACGKTIGAYVTIDARTGRVLRRRVLIQGTGAIGAIALSQRKQRLFVSDYMICACARDNKVYEIDARAGRVLSPITTSGHPSSLVVDDSANLILAGSQGGLDAVDMATRRIVTHILLSIDRIWGSDAQGNYIVSTAEAVSTDQPGLFDRVRALVNMAGASIGIDVNANSSIAIVHIDDHRGNDH